MISLFSCVLNLKQLSFHLFNVVWSVIFSSFTTKYNTSSQFSFKQRDTHSVRQNAPSRAPSSFAVRPSVRRSREITDRRPPWGGGWVWGSASLGVEVRRDRVLRGWLEDRPRRRDENGEHGGEKTRSAGRALLALYTGWTKLQVFADDEGMCDGWEIDLMAMSFCRLCVCGVRCGWNGGGNYKWRESN